MDRLAACHAMYGFLHLPNSGRGRHTTAPNCQHVKRSLSLMDRRGIISPGRGNGRGLISPLPPTGHRQKGGGGGGADDWKGMASGGGHHSMGRLHNLGLIHALGGTAGLMLLPAAAAMELRNRKHNRSFTYGRRRESEGTSGEHCIGQLLVSLRYSPADNQLCVGIVRASGIRSAAPYVTVWMIRDGQKTQKRSTPKLTGADSRRYSIAPVFDEAFPFDVSSIELQNSTLIISVMNSGTGGDSDTEIGYCVLGELGVDETSREHWREAVGRPGQIITQWHGLMADW